MDRPAFIEACRSRKVCWGTVLHEFMVPQTVRILKRAGLDWLWIDNEHAQHSYESIQEVIRTADDVGLATVMRVTQRDYARIAGAYDMGVDGVIVPRVETPDDVRYIVDSARYAPIGRRGFGIRPTVWGRENVPMRARIEDQNKQRLLIIQLESPQAVNYLEEMLEVGKDAIDAVFFGPADFQVTIGKPDSYDAPEVDAAARRMTAICKERSLSNGLPASSSEDAQLWLDRGFNLIVHSNDDGFMYTAAAQAMRALKALA